MKEGFRLSVFGFEGTNCIFIYADVAQLAEQLICNQQVNGSSPLIGSNYLKRGTACNLQYLLFLYIFLFRPSFFRCLLPQNHIK